MMYRSLILAVVLSVTSSQAREEKDLIYRIDANKNSLTIEVNPEFKNSYLLSDFFATYEEDIDLSLLDYSISVLPFILNVVPIVWISGETYYIEKMDRDVYVSLGTVKRVLQQLYPKTSFDGELVPRKLIENASPGITSPRNSQALLFSGGLDSTASLVAHSDKDLHLITVRGQWDVPLSRDHIWRERVTNFKKVTKEYGCTQSFITSNFAEFLNWDVLDALSPEIASWRLDTTEGIGMFGLAIPVLYLKGISVLSMAASYHWSYPWPSAANPLIDNSMKCAKSITFNHDQFDYTRSQKMELIVNKVRAGLIDPPQLKVCDGRRVQNCQSLRCSKCIPTAFTLAAYGEDPREYGFAMSANEVIKRAKEYLKKKQLYWTLWELMILKDTLMQRGYEKKFEWFLSTDLGSLVNVHHIQEKTIVDWSRYTDHGVLVPVNKIRKLG